MKTIKIILPILIFINIFGCSSTSVRFNTDAQKTAGYKRQNIKKTYSNPKYITKSKKYHIVKRKDNLTQISKKYKISVQKLMLFNNLTTDTLLLGQKVYLTPNLTDKNIFITVKDIPKNEYHITKKGEDLFTLSKMYDIYIMNLIDFNQLETYSLFENQKVWLTAGHENEIERVKTIKNKKTTSVKNKNININKKKSKQVSVKKNKIPEEVDIKKKYPAPVKITSIVGEFGKNGKIMNKGIDLAAPSGTPIYAIKSGTIIFAGAQKGYGNVIIIDHKNGVMTVYAHNQKNLVRSGDKTKKNQPIATVGKTGRAETPKLHFEYRIKGRAIDPRKVLSI